MHLLIVRERQCRRTEVATNFKVRTLNEDLPVFAIGAFTAWRDRVNWAEINFGRSQAFVNVELTGFTVLVDTVPIVEAVSNVTGLLNLCDKNSTA